MTEIRICHKFSKVPTGEKILTVNTCNNTATNFERDINPFLIGPCYLYIHHKYGKLISQNFESAYQFSKLYIEDSKDGQPTEAYWNWARNGWADDKPHRYPKGKGRVPLGSLWEGKLLGYIDARKQIYAPLYAECVLKTVGYQRLLYFYESCQYDTIYLRDWDGYDHDKLGMTLTEVLNFAGRKCGHSFILKMLLTNDEALKQCKIRDDLRYE